MRFRRLAFLDLATLDRDDLDLEPIAAQAETVVRWPTTSADELQTHMADADAVIVNKVRLGAEAFAAARPRIICLAATGTDNVDLAAARKTGVAVANIRDYCTDSVVQHVFALLLALTTHLLDYRERLQADAWAEAGIFTLLDLPVRELAGKTLAVIGYGTLGRAVAARAENFGMHVVIAERHGATPRAGRIAFEQALAAADVISLHVPLTDATRNMINAQTLALMKPDALLINTARGGLVDERALADALAGGRLGGAGLDVLSREPPPRDHILLDPALPNCIVTPHIAWAAREARQRAIHEIGANLAAFLAGESRNRVV
ncbi:MAG: NAD(P)-dependent oxidoreductase [Gammaproteobacteria bacterium]